MPKRRSARRTAAQMRPLVASWRRGEGSQAAIAARHGMPAPTFSWWCARLAGERAAPSRFVAVDVAADPASSPAAPFEVLLPRGVEVRVPAGFDAAALSRLVAALERPC